MFISLLGLLLDILEELVLGALGNVAVVIANHLVEECLGLIRAVGLEDEVVDHVDDPLAVTLKLFLDLYLVVAESSAEF